MKATPRCYGAWAGVGIAGDCNLYNIWGSSSSGALNININGGVINGPNSARHDDGFSARCVLELKKVK